MESLYSALDANDADAVEMALKSDDLPEDWFRIVDEYGFPFSLLHSLISPLPVLPLSCFASLSYSYSAEMQ